MDAKTQELAKGINQKLFLDAAQNKIKFDDIGDLSRAAMEKIPSLQSVIANQSKMSKALALGYMAITSTSDIYGEAIMGGYDRRTAGFAALAAAAGQYGIMMNNRMGDWFLDKTTGYSTEVNKSLIRQGVKPWFDEIAAGFKSVTHNTVDGKKQLSGTFGKIKNSLTNIFTSPSAIGEAMWKNAIVEGVEEVTEQLVLDATKGVVDTMSYLGLTEKKGSFGGWNNAFSQQGFENYLANFIGGVIGGGMFEFHRSKIAPWLDPSMVSKDVQKSLYELVAGGHRDEIIDIINKNRQSLGNKYVTAPDMEGNFQESKDGNISQADLIADKAIEMVNVIDGILNSYDLIQSDEEIINKAILDKIIINDLKKTAQEGKYVGIEGLILEDYKLKMSKLVELDSKIKNLKDTEEDKKAEKLYKDELKIYVKDVQDILEGKHGSKYFRQATLALNKAIHAPFIKISKADYVEKTYEVDYNSLPETGVGLTKERIDKEWSDYLSSTNLKTQLETADKVYTALEQILNDPISKYAETGYDVVRAESLKQILDLKTTIDLFNTATDPEVKQKALERFVETNNKLQGSGVVAPWTVLHNDIFEQLSDLGLIKKTSYTADADGNLITSEEDFDPDELNFVEEGKGSKKDSIKGIVQAYFKQFPFNPFSAEDAIEKLNINLDSHNKQILQKIAKLESNPDITPEIQQEIEELRSQLYEFRIGSFTSTAEAQQIIKLAKDKLDKVLVDSSLTVEQIQKYKSLIGSEELFKNNFNELLSEFGEDSWKKLDILNLGKFLEKLEALGVMELGLAKVNEISSNVSEAYAEELMKLNPETLTEEEFLKLQEFLTPIIDTLENLLNENNSLLNNKEISDVITELDTITETLNNEIEALKPEILKVHNYALDLLVESLSGGNADKEVFSEAEKLANEEMSKVVSNVFPDAKNFEYKDLEKILEESKLLIDALNEEFTMSDQGIDGYYTSFNTIEEVLVQEEAEFAKDASYKGLFPSIQILNFVKNNFDKQLSLATLSSALKNSLSVSKLNKESINRINKFLGLQSKGITLKSNPLYDFIRKFELTLNSNPANKTAKIFDLLEKEEVTLKSSSNVTNYLSDNIREQDLLQAISHLEMIKAVVNAMSTTQVSFGDPYGFIQSRINYAKKYNQEDDVLKLKTISSDVATLMAGDLDVLITKLKFLADLSVFNTGKRMNEQETIRTQVDSILIGNWTQTVNKMNPSFLPLEKIKNILATTENNSSKLMKIENAVFEHNIENKIGALEEFLKHLEMVDSDQFSQIDKDVKKLESWDIAVYFATVLAMKAEDFNIRTLFTTNSQFNKAPFYTQELAARVIKASTVNPELFAKILEIKSNSSKLMTDFITIVLGGSGTGKTSAVLALALDNFRQTNESSNIWVVAPTDLQKDNLNNAIIESIGTSKITTFKDNKNELFDKLGIRKLVDAINVEIDTIEDDKAERKYVKLENGIITLTDEILKNEWIEAEVAEKLQNLPNLLLIDEVTHFSSFELYLLNAISKHSYAKDSLNFMKIIATGDPTQLGNLVKVNKDYYSYNVDGINAIFTPRLWATIRSANNQKRLNNDRYIRVVRELEKIYKGNKSDYEKSSNEALAYLEMTKDLNTLAYYETSTAIAGDKIVKDLDKSIVNILAAKQQADPKVTIGIMTSDGNLPEEWNQLLSEAGIITPNDSSRIKLFTPKNVQGSEVDYFIFDADAITLYDKIRDNLKAFYTFKTRSKIASIIVDKENVLEKFKIANAKKDLTSTPFEFLTPQVVKAAKEKRALDLETLLGKDAKTSPHDNFKWKVSNLETKEDLVDSRFVGPEIPEISLLHPMVNSKEEKIIENIALKDDFKILLHTFYNNPGAVIDKSGNIIVNNNDPATDLNFLQNVDSIESKSVIKQWIALKNHLLHLNFTEKTNKPVTTILSTDFNAYLKQVFKGDISTSEWIGIEPVFTVTKYDNAINIPFAKHGFNADKTLDNGKLMINLSVKLTLGQKTHYITLATFGTYENIVKKAQEYKVSIDAITARFAALEKTLDSSKDKMISLKIDNLSDIEFLTSTRLEKTLKTPKSAETQKFALTELEEAFPGMQFSEIRFFPQSEAEFAVLMKSYTFGTERFTGEGITKEETAKRLKILFEGLRDEKGNLIEDENGKTNSGLRNKPYIVATTANDLNGNINSNKTQAVLIPIGANKRKLPTLIKEVNDLLDQRKEELGNSTNFKLSDAMNVKTEALLNRSDILSVLIKWGTTKVGDGTLLDLLTKEIEFSISDTITGSKISVLEIFNRFKTNERTITKDKLIQVINLVKSEITKNNGDTKKIKKKVISQLSETTGWHWTFFNIFAYEKIIEETENAEIRELMLKNLVDDKIFEAFNESKGSTEMKEILGQLVNAIKGFDFYYSIPIRPAKVEGGAFMVSDHISGVKGFTPETFGDKFFIGITPEGPKLLLKVDTFLNASLIDESNKPAFKPGPAPKPVPTPAPVPAIEINQQAMETIKDDITLQVDLTIAEAVAADYGNMTALKPRSTKELFIELTNFLNVNFGWGVTSIKYSKTNNLITFTDNSGTYVITAASGKKGNSTYMTNSLREIIEAKYGVGNVVNDNTDLINLINSKIVDKDLKDLFAPILHTISDKLMDEMTTRITSVNSEVFNEITDTEKIIMILQEAGFVIQNNAVVLSSIETALNLNKKADMELIKTLKQKINTLLETCK